ncbi:serine/threonine-protein kinase [Candidatus Moduliflexus flocculans]|uniref:Serine/threonine-protein kinase n=1 Tax=Candidatus Moduliflexus flocculans TaxID=1499966 RepID=A0A081BRU2_9BACT|nr:serine/threonine-protein kinase [Candidatus Moduliflexus flocculans]
MRDYLKDYTPENADLWRCYAGNQDWQYLTRKASYKKVERMQVNVESQIDSTIRTLYEKIDALNVKEFRQGRLNQGKLTQDEENDRTYFIKRKEILERLTGNEKVLLAIMAGALPYWFTLPFTPKGIIQKAFKTYREKFSQILKTHADQQEQMAAKLEHDRIKEQERIAAQNKAKDSEEQRIAEQFSLIQRAIQASQWETAFKAIQQLLGTASRTNQAKALLLRAQCYFGRAQGADIRLGLQDVEQVIAQYQDAPVLQELLEVATQLCDAEYLRETGSQTRFPREYDRILTLLITDIERRFKAAVKAGNADNLLDIALQLWRIGYRDVTVKLLDELGNGYAQQIAKDVNAAQRVISIADDYWKRAQEQPDMAVYDAIAERLWQAVATALEKQLPLAKITAQNVEPYYLLFKAYQALRDLPKCEAVGLKILGVTGIDGYKDARPIVDNLVTGGFDEQQWRSTGDGAAAQPAAPTGSAEQFGAYRGVFYTKGGMGEIYKGVAPDGSPVAIKRIPRYALNGVRLERFLREMQIVRHLAHPHIVTVLDVNEQGGYYVMEWAEGGTLDAQLKQSNTLPLPDALRIAFQMAQALEVIHQQGIVHRDIKPHNILLFPNDVAKLTDFGVAHVERAATLTGEGVQVGTLRYMSPEQYMADKIDGTTDIFALGLALHEMLTGHIPFANQTELCQKDIEEIFAARRPPLPEAVTDILLKCLRNNANRRCSASELRADLQRVAAVTQD